MDPPWNTNYNTKHAQYTNVKHNPKVGPFGFALVKKRQIKLGDAGTIDCFDLVFQNQITKMLKNKGQTKSQIQTTI